MIRYVLAALLAAIGWFTAYQAGVGLLGLSTPLDAQLFAVMMAALLAAGYDQLARSPVSADDQD